MLNQISFRDLHDALLAHDGESVYAELLLPWLRTSGDQQTWLRSLGHREGAPVPLVSLEESWELYALSRVLDLLILGFQKPGPDAGWEGPQISMGEFLEFIKVMGLRSLTPASFSPFHHEIVDARLSDKASPVPEIISSRWPCVMLGNLLVLRGGIELEANAKVLDPDLARSTTLYWAYRRKGRPHRDLSHGWGSNSQWRTTFRRDYAIGNMQYFNVDGKYDLHAKGSELKEVLEACPELTLDERIELLTNRCFIRCVKPHDDLLPYDDRFQKIVI